MKKSGYAISTKDKKRLKAVATTIKQQAKRAGVEVAKVWKEGSRLAMEEIRKTAEAGRKEAQVKGEINPTPSTPIGQAFDMKEYWSTVDGINNTSPKKVASGLANTKTYERPLTTIVIKETKE